MNFIQAYEAMRSGLIVRDAEGCIYKISDVDNEVWFIPYFSGEETEWQWCSLSFNALMEDGYQIFDKDLYCNVSGVKIDS